MIVSAHRRVAAGLASVAAGFMFSIAGSATGAAMQRGCGSSDITLSLGPEVVPMTGEHADLIELTNRSTRSCVLDGYPRISLSDRGRHLAFVYSDGGGLYVTRRTPRPVTLGPGRHGYFLVAKYRCDVGNLYPVTSIRVVLPGTNGPLTVGLREPGSGELDYCKRPGDRRVDPGNRVAVSPIEARSTSAISLP